MSVKIDIGHRPGLKAEEIVEVLKDQLDEGCEVYKTGRLMVPDVMVKQSDRDGAAVQILQKRLRKKTVLKVYGLAPSATQRGWTPAGLVLQAQRTKPLVEYVAGILESSDRLRMTQLLKTF